MLKESRTSCSYINKLSQVFQVSLVGSDSISLKQAVSFLLGVARNLLVSQVNEMH